uniref:CS domain-containing protein n=1 Tax=Salmo trutta TaxID=8032 RepID=A0A674CD99_SALTR
LDRVCTFFFDVGWDQSKIKMYITLNGVHNIAPENVKVTLQRDRAMYFVLLVKYLYGKNRQMTINNFLYPIDVQDSSKKVKICHLASEQGS